MEIQRPAQGCTREPLILLSIYSHLLTCVHDPGLRARGFFFSPALTRKDLSLPITEHYATVKAPGGTSWFKTTRLSQSAD